ncbi:hypothetical protein CEP52_012561 [Fusarium oligoseptatum]|uniref:Uncharacterized protein n=1 Tax=Fusarium oligoseptatum TaxID=2604345 RepID=A0A428SXN2_9HYPO|nr:hypothetical protein CEP52_012561 [Fusarium oligoseptatum]
MASSNPYRQVQGERTSHESLFEGDSLQLPFSGVHLQQVVLFLGSYSLKCSWLEYSDPVDQRDKRELVAVCPWIDTDVTDSSSTKLRSSSAGGDFGKPGFRPLLDPRP